MKNILTLFAGMALLIIVSKSDAQDYQQNNSIPVYHNGTLIELPWCGGFNSPQFYNIDLNFDGIDDLFVFDRDGDRITTLKNNGGFNQISYTNAPEFRAKFPPMQNFVVLYDYTCDGKKDIITSAGNSNAWVKCYKNTSTSMGGISFVEDYSSILTKLGPIVSNLIVSQINIPACTDIDNDGDMDLLNFSFSGFNIEYHKNMGVENFNKCDTLVMEQQLNCFGNMELNSFANTANLFVQCRLAFPTENFDSESQLSLLHSGSCLNAQDFDHDGDKDLINGDILGQNLLYLHNGGDSSYAEFTFQDTIFPSNSTPVDLTTFPSSYYVDVNNDNKKDLLVSPCTPLGTENYNNVLYYSNISSGISDQFSLQSNSLFVDQMIEVGTGANVVLMDLNSDNLLDLIVGNYGYFDGTSSYSSQLSYYENTGTSTMPVFSLISNDFANVSNLSTDNAHPTFGDMDADGDLDMLVGDVNGNVHYYTNTGTSTSPNYSLTTPLLQGIDVGQFAAPFIVDLNRDGLLDFICGRSTGTIKYFQNSGSLTNPIFTLVTDTLGGVSVNLPGAFYGFSSPCVIDSSGIYKLYVGSESGKIFYYDNIDGNLSGNFTLVDSSYGNIHEPARLSIAVGNLDNDAFQDLILGVNSGGLVSYEQTSPVAVSENPTTQYLILYPTPASDKLYLRCNSGTLNEKRFHINNIHGKEVLKGYCSPGTTTIGIENLLSGMYFITIENISQKFLIIK